MSQTLESGSTLHGRYTILSTLGRGSFANVYLARDAESKGMMVALKEISTEGFTEEEYRDLNTQFLQEAAFLMQLDHPGLPKVVEFFAEGSRYYLAMEWIAGKTLHEIVSEKGPADETDVLDWGVQLSDILSYLHGRQPYPVVLGDLKPSNVMITYDGRVKVIDFGVARYLAPSQNPRTFALVSPGFSPPEKYSKFDSDQRGDLYSLGATLYWALTRAQLEKFRFQLPPLRRLRPECSQWLERVLAQCLMVEPTKRWVRASAVKEQFQQIAEDRQKQEERERETPANILGELYRRKSGPKL